MAVGANALLTDNSSIRRILRLDSSYTAQDLLIDQAIDRATERITRWCGRSVIRNASSAVTVTEYHSGNASDVDLRLAEYPVISVTTLKEDDAGTTETLASGTQYKLFTDDGTVVRLDDLSSAPDAAAVYSSNNRRPWLKGTNNIEVVYAPGWANLTTMPDVLGEACERLALQYLNTSSQSGHRNVGMGILRADIVLGMPPDVQEMILPYRLHRYVSAEERV